MKWFSVTPIFPETVSPSMRREWIEMPWTYWNGNYAVSPSMRREWIEMPWTYWNGNYAVSPSMRREWIEMW